MRIILDTISGQIHGFDDKLITDVTYTKEEIDRMVSSVFRFKGIVNTVADLPTTGNKVGDVYVVRADASEYVWTSENKWEQLGPILDLSAYYTKTEINAMLGSVPEGKTIMSLIGLDGTEGKSLKQLHDELAARVTTAEGSITSIQERNTHADKKIAEIFRRVGDGEFKRPEEETFQEDKLYYSRNSDGEYKQLQWGTDYNFGDPIPENVYDRAAWSNISERMANAEGRISSAEEGLQTLDGRVTTNEGNITTLQTDLTATQARLKDTLYAYNYNFTTSKLSDPFDAEKGHGECTMELLNAARANKAIRIIALNKTDVLGDQPVNFSFVNTKREVNRIIGTPLIGVTYTMYFYAHVLSDRLAQLEVKYTWAEPAAGGEPMEPVLGSVTATKYEFNYTAVDSEESKPETANKGDICVVRKTLGDNSIQYTGYVWNGSQWSAMDGNYDAESVIMGANITLAGDYTAVGNIKMTDGTLSCKGWTVAKLFKEIFNKTLNPTLGDAPTVTLTLNGSGYKEVGEVIVPHYSMTFNQGKYNQPWNGGTQDDGTTAKKWYAEDGRGTTVNKQTADMNSYTMSDDVTYTLNGKADYNAGVYGKDNTGADSPIRREAGTTAVASKSFTPFRYMYIGSIATDAEITEAVIKGLTKFTCGAVTKTLKASGGDIPLVSGAVKVIVAIPVVTTGKAKSACGGYTLNQVLLVSASNTPITSDYKAKDDVMVSGNRIGYAKKAYKVWVYQPASIDPGEVHSIKIA